MEVSGGAQRAEDNGQSQRGGGGSGVRETRVNGIQQTEGLKGDFERRSGRKDAG